MPKFMLLLFLTILITSCRQANNSYNRNNEIIPNSEVYENETFNFQLKDTSKPKANLKPVNKHYPFELRDFDGQYQIVAEIESKELYPKYFDLFRKHDYEGNGYCWEGHITQILEKLDKNLLSHIDFDPEAGGFYANADSKENQLKFVVLLSPIFSDMKKLEQWIKKANRSRIDD